MARTKARKRTRAQAVKAADNASQAKSSSSKAQYTASQLLSRAEELLTQGEYDLCCQFCQRALQQEPQNVAVLECLGTAELELGKVEEANEHFLQIVSHARPDQPELSSAHLYLAQLVELPLEAVSHFQSALDVLRARLAVLPASTSPQAWSIEESEIRRACSRSLIGMTELYMTDLCFEEDASSRCTAYTDLAVALDPTDPDALATKASVLLSQEKAAEAKDLIEASYALWKDAEERPPVDSRLKCARLMLECQLNEEAVEVLRGTTDDEEDNADAWYLLGMALGLLAETAGEEGSELLIEAREALELCLSLHEQNQEEDQEGMFKHAKELLDKLIKAGVPAPEHEEPDGDEDEWIDDDDGDNNSADAMQS